MLMISSATRSRISRSSARAISRRWSWPPLSWCGYLCSTWLGSRPTASSEASTRDSHSASGTPGKYTPRIMPKTWSALKIGLYELNGSWNTPWTSR